jgi:ComF family protein
MDGSMPNWSAGIVAGYRQAMRQNHWRRSALDLVFPPDCAACQIELEPGGELALCETCRASMIDLREACERCGAQTAVAGQLADCANCRDRRLAFAGVIRLGAYEGALRSAVLAIKRERGRPLAIALGDLMVNTMLARFSALNVDAVVPVPMHWSRHLLRGVNSPQVIAQRIARKLNVPVVGGLLVRRRRTAPQAELSPSQRLANVRGAFRVRAHPDLRDSRLLLVDDIMTTGATAGEAARVLRRAGAAFVEVAVVARA